MKKTTYLVLFQKYDQFWNFFLKSFHYKLLIPEQSLDIIMFWIFDKNKRRSWNRQLYNISTPLTSTVVTITIVFTTKGDFFSSESRPFTLTVQKQFVTPSGDGGCSFRWSVPFLTKIRKKYRKILYKRLKNIRVENNLPLCVDLGTH